MTYSSPSGGRQTQTSLGLELLRHGLATLHGSYDPNRHANGPSSSPRKTPRSTSGWACGSIGPRRRRLRRRLRRKPRRRARLPVVTVMKRPQEPKPSPSSVPSASRRLSTPLVFFANARVAIEPRGCTRSSKRSRPIRPEWVSNPGRARWSPGASPATTSGTAR